MLDFDLEIEEVFEIEDDPNWPQVYQGHKESYGHLVTAVFYSEFVCTILYIQPNQWISDCSSRKFEVGKTYNIKKDNGPFGLKSQMEWTLISKGEMY